MTIFPSLPISSNSTTEASGRPHSREDRPAGTPPPVNPHLTAEIGGSHPPTQWPVLRTVAWVSAFGLWNVQILLAGSFKNEWLHRAQLFSVRCPAFAHSQPFPWAWAAPSLGGRRVFHTVTPSFTESSEAESAGLGREMEVLGAVELLVTI